ncbi:MAG TPA: hypothetical protein VKD90_09570 [Gemmataceae bacterium]|nr:hypothetical protein [Gemmataceae bacterium]
MASVFVVQHVHSRDDGVEDVKFIGVYSSRQNAEAAVARLSRLPGFADAPAGFHVDEYRVDQDQWTEGYVAVAGA